MPDNFERSAATPPKSVLGSTIFTQRKNDILQKLIESVEKVKLNYNGRKELANEKDEIVAELCEALDETFNYGLRQQNNFVVTAASLFQNMQEVITGNSTTNMSNEASFWDFCQIHLTPHERNRFENELKHVWTKHGRGKAFIRAALNENSLQRYLLTWLSDRELLGRYFTHWSLLLDEEAAKKMTEIIGSLDKILFALTVDGIDLNKQLRTAPIAVVTKEEPIIFAPMPSTKSKRRTNAIERPIATTNSTEDFIKNLGITLPVNDKDKPYIEINGKPELAADILVESTQETEEDEEQEQEKQPFDPIEPELEFLKQPLPDVYPENQTILHARNSMAPPSNGPSERDFEDKSDSSSQYSKTSSNNESTSNCAALEMQLRELNERYALLETRVAQLTLENRQLLRRLTHYFSESGVDPSSSFATNFLITIPTVKLINPRNATSYYVYEVHITMRHRLEHWSVLRRYRDFHKLHKTLLRTHPQIASVDLPPKKHFGNKNLIFVEERRQQLQIYLLNLVESLPQVESCKTKVELQKVFPFLRER